MGETTMGSGAVSGLVQYPGWVGGMSTNNVTKYISTRETRKKSENN